MGGEELLAEDEIAQAIRCTDKRTSLLNFTELTG